MRYSLRTLLIVFALTPAIVWALTTGLAIYRERAEMSAYKPAPARGKDEPRRAVKVLKQSWP